MTSFLNKSMTSLQRLILLLLTIQLTLVANAMVYDDDNSLGEYNLTNAIITGLEKLSGSFLVVLNVVAN